MLYLKTDEVKLIREYLGRRINTNDFVFVGKNGKPVQACYLRAMVEQASIGASVTKDVHPYILRHTLSTDLYRSTRNLRLTWPTAALPPLKFIRMWPRLNWKML